MYCDKVIEVIKSVAKSDTFLMAKVFSMTGHSARKGKVLKVKKGDKIEIKIKRKRKRK